MRVIESATKGHAYEDSRIELKAKLPEPEKAARRIAGHANSALSDKILWLIGVDEREGVTGIQREEFADWWSQVKRCFDGTVPECTEVFHHHGEHLVLCLLFKTDRPPYLVKNAKGGEIQREVPWRDGTTVRTAKREELLRILAPVVAQPQTETVSAYIRPTDRFGTQFMGGIRVFVTIPEDTSITIPLHRCEGGLMHNGHEVMHFSSIRGINSHQFGAVGDQVRLEGPSVLHLQFEGQSNAERLEGFPTLTLRLKLSFASDTPPIEVSQPINQTPADKSFFQFGPLG